MGYSSNSVLLFNTVGWLTIERFIKKRIATMAKISSLFVSHNSCAMLWIRLSSRWAMCCVYFQCRGMYDVACHWSGLLTLPAAIWDISDISFNSVLTLEHIFPHVCIFWWNSHTHIYRVLAVKFNISLGAPLTIISASYATASCCSDFLFMQ